MKVYLNNSSNSNLYTVARVAFPYLLNLPTKPTLRLTNGTELPLVFEKNVGDISKIYTVRGLFNPGITVADLIEGSTDETVFTLSNWVTKHLVGTVLRVWVTLPDDQELLIWSDSSPKHIRATAHVQTFDFNSYVNQGFKLKQFLTAFTEMDHVEFKIALNWHDRNDPTYGKQVKRIRLECSDEFVVHFANSMGFSKPRYIMPTDTWSLDLIPNPQEIGDGQGFELRGYILTMPENMITGMDDLTDSRIRNLDAVRNGVERLGGVGEVVGLYENMDNVDGIHNWFNRYLPSKDQIPYNPNSLNGLFWQYNLFGLRSRGCTPTPGQTGGQQDFGADKGFEATVMNDPSWITFIKGALVDRFRYFNLHEPDGTRLLASNHPNRKTWNMGTIFFSEDKLGKSPLALRPNGTGYQGYDNQHRSANNLFTYYALTGDELVLDTLLNFLETDLQQTRNFDLADREIGRMFNFFAKLLRVVPADQRNKVINVIGTRYAELEQDWRGRFLTNNPDRDVRVLQVIIDPRSGCINPETNKVEPTWIPFQCAQLIQGMYSLYLEIGSEAILNILKNVCTTFMKYGIFKQGNMWYPVMFCRYVTGLPSGENIKKNEMAPSEGFPLPQSSFYFGSWEVQVDPFYHQGWWDWISPAIAISKKILTDESLKSKASEILSYAYPNGFTKLESAEWFATSLS